MFRRLSLAVAASILMAGAAYADPIEGNWRTEAGSTARISSCGDSFCITLTTGSHAGKTIGRIKANGEEYTGSITDPADDTKYRGKAWLPSNSQLRLRGYSGIFWKTQTWSRL